MVKFQLRKKTDIAAVFCNWNDTNCFWVFEREREERDWGKLALSFGDEIEREYYRTRRSHSHSCCRYNFLCDKSVRKTTVWQFWKLYSTESVFHLFTAIRRRENGWYDEEHPLVFLFLGSSGIGKFRCFFGTYLVYTYEFSHKTYAIWYCIINDCDVSLFSLIVPSCRKNRACQTSGSLSS